MVVVRIAWARRFIVFSLLGAMLSVSVLPIRAWAQADAEPLERVGQTVDANGETITLLFNKALDETSVPAAEAFVVLKWFDEDDPDFPSGYTRAAFYCIAGNTSFGCPVALKSVAVTGTCEAEDFPTLGETVTLEWQQNSQNFVIAGGSPPAGATPGRTSALTEFLENPGHNSFQSGVRVLSGWVCDADTVELAIGNTGRQVAAYGTERVDTLDACGDTDNGFGLLFNWNLLGEGEHEVVAYVDDVELGRATVRVTTVGEGAEEEFLRGVEGECVVEDFPTEGETVTLEWQQNSQNFVMTDVGP